MFEPIYQSGMSDHQPTLPFDSYLKRTYSCVSRSTLSGSPSPFRNNTGSSPVWSDTCDQQKPVAKPIRYDSGPLSHYAGTRVGRFHVSCEHPKYIPPASIMPVKVFYERQYPPMPKVQSIYTEAKKAEYDGDYELALELYLKAVNENERADSAMKDYAGLLHMKGETKAAIDFMETQSAHRKSLSMGFRNLLSQLKATYEREISNDSQHLPKVILMTVDCKSIDARIEYETLRSMIPNCLKITRIVFVNPVMNSCGFPSSIKALIEFSSHSAARKAVMVAKHDSIKCCWASSTPVFKEHFDSHELETRNGVSNGDVKGVYFTQLLETIPDLIEAKHIQLVKGGCFVRVAFATVPPHVMDYVWPKILAGSHISKDTHIALSGPPDDAATTDVTTNNTLSLPIPQRRVMSIDELDHGIENISELRERRGMANLPLIEDDDDSQTCDSHVTMDWCMNTPSPIRHVASLF